MNESNYAKHINNKLDSIEKRLEDINHKLDDVIQMLNIDYEEYVGKDANELEKALKEDMIINVTLNIDKKGLEDFFAVGVAQFNKLETITSKPLKLDLDYSSLTAKFKHAEAFIKDQLVKYEDILRSFKDNIDRIMSGFRADQSSSQKASERTTRSSATKFGAGHLRPHEQFGISRGEYYNILSYLKSKRKPHEKFREPTTEEVQKAVDYRKARALKEESFPSKIEPKNFLKQDEVYIFGSDLSGRKIPSKAIRLGLQQGHVEGPSGQLYAIPKIVSDPFDKTKTVPFKDLKKSISELVSFIKENPDKKFFFGRGTANIGYGRDTYEVAVMYDDQLTYPMEDDVVGHLTADKVTAYMDKVQRLPVKEYVYPGSDVQQ